MTEQDIINTTADFVKQALANTERGHNWFHIERVWKNARLIAASETVNTLVVELAALLHDIADAKFHDGDETIGPATAKQFLEILPIDAVITEHVVNIVAHISFKGGNHDQVFYSPELGVVQDADRLDAIGAIGIARAFHYGGFKDREIYDPAIAPNLQMTKEEYKNSQAPTINHFYEKLLLLKDRMNTSTGKKLALQRHTFMENYLQQFYGEWNGEL
jgi:uncharacterized protein